MARTDKLRKAKLQRLQSVTDKAADSVEAALDASDTKTLKDAMAALKELVGITRDVYDMPTRAQEQTMLLATMKIAGTKADDEESPGVVEIAVREKGDDVCPEP